MAKEIVYKLHEVIRILIEHGFDEKDYPTPFMLYKKYRDIPFLCKLRYIGEEVIGDDEIGVFISIQNKWKVSPPIFWYNYDESGESYGFSPIFNGTFQWSSSRKIYNWSIKKGVYGLSGKKLSEDISYILYDYRRVHGRKFTESEVRDILSGKVVAKRKGDFADEIRKSKIRDEWQKLLPKIRKEFEPARDLGFQIMPINNTDFIRMSMPDLLLLDDAELVFFKISEPDEIRYPEDYPKYEKYLDSLPEHTKYVKHIRKMEAMIIKFVKKHNLSYVAAPWYK